MISAILAVLFAIKILASHSQIYRLPKIYLFAINEKVFFLLDHKLYRDEDV